MKVPSKVFYVDQGFDKNDLTQLWKIWHSGFHALGLKMSGICADIFWWICSQMLSFPHIYALWPVGDVSMAKILVCILIYLIKEN